MALFCIFCSMFYALCFQAAGLDKKTKGWYFQGINSPLGSPARGKTFFN